jgi:uncharacterized protein
MKLKKSNYNVEIEALEDGNKLIYNTYSGVFGIMDKKTQAIFDSIESTKVVLVDASDTGNEMGNINTRNETLKTVDIMFRAGYIVDADKDELTTIKLERAKGRHRENALNITIAPSLDCNMACPYCFEDRDDLVMSIETQSQLVSFVKTHLEGYPNIKHLGISWYGGEPLMQKDIIYSLSEKLIKLCKEKGVKYSASIISNGILLDPETAKHLKDYCKISGIQITIDGLKETHNARRILIGDGDGFDIIVNNIEACKDILNISVRVNVDKENVCDIKQLTRYFLEEKGWKGKPSFHLAPIDDYDGTCLISKSKCLLGEEFAAVDIQCIRATYAHNRDAVVHQFFPSRKPVFCGGESVLGYVVGPNGSVYNCYVHIGNRERITGHVSKPFVFTDEYGKWLLSDIHSKCEKCSFLPMCMGGCMVHRMNNGGEPTCFRTFYTYKDVLKLAYDDYLIQVSKQEVSTTENDSVSAKKGASL